MNCLKCGAPMSRENTKIWNTHARAQDPKYIVCQNYHCPKCKSVFTTGEIKKYLDEIEAKNLTDEKINWDIYQDLVADAIETEIKE